MGRSHWYEPGDWKLPGWWTDNPPARGNERLTYEEQKTFYSGWFVVNVLKHKGGIYALPKTV